MKKFIKKKKLKVGHVYVEESFDTFSIWVMMGAYNAQPPLPKDNKRQ